MRKLVLTGLGSLLWLCAHAQSSGSPAENAPQWPARWSVGIEGGVSRNYLITNISSLPFSRLQPGNGYSAAILIQYQWNKWLALCTDPGLIQKSYSLTRTGFFDGTRQSTTNQYLQLPMMARFILGEGRLRGFVNLGGYGAYWASGTVAGSLPDLLDPSFSGATTGVGGVAHLYNYHESYQFNSTRDNRFEWGWIAGIGISYQLSRALQVFIEGRNMHSLTDQQKKYQSAQVPKYDQTYSLTGGILMKVTAIQAAFRKPEQL